jgi:hypothetical protein
MISRRIGPISPARTRPGPSDDADDTIAASVDRFGLGNSPRTFGIGITPNASVEVSVPHFRTRRQGSIEWDIHATRAASGHSGRGERRRHRPTKRALP